MSISKSAKAKTATATLVLAFGLPAFVAGTAGSFFISGPHLAVLGLVAALATTLVALPFWRAVMKQKNSPRRGAIAGAFIGTVGHPVTWLLMTIYSWIIGTPKTESWVKAIASIFHFSAFSIVYSAGATILIYGIIGHAINKRLHSES